VNDLHIDLAFASLFVALAAVAMLTIRNR